MRNIRTDLASELNEDAGALAGVRVQSDEIGGFSCTKVYVDSEEGAKKLGKPIGKYFTLEVGDVSLKNSVDLTDAAHSVASVMQEFIGAEGGKTALVVGLGNRRITPDSLGPKVCEKIFVTRHIKQNLPEIAGEDVASVSAIAPGVLGVTGMESEEVIRGVSQQVKPDVIIAIDALASRKTERIGASIQISNTGIAPGSGLGNHRKELTQGSLGAMVIAIGVPMVTYASTIACDLLEAAFDKTVEEEDIQALFAAIQAANGAELIVTPKNIDILSEKTAVLLALSLNFALNPDFPQEKIDNLMEC